MKACDTAGPLNPTAAKAAGVEVVGLYLNGYLSPAVAQACTTEGLGIFSLWEGNPLDPAGGQPQGRADAIAASDIALTIRQPKGSAIYMPSDTIVTDWTAWRAYFAAAFDVLTTREFVAGFYGQVEVWNVIKQDRLWASEYGRLFQANIGNVSPSPAAVLFQTGNQAQIAGVTVDVDDLLGDPAAWNYDGLWHSTALEPEGIPVNALLFICTDSPVAGQAFLTDLVSRPIGPLSKQAEGIANTILPKDRKFEGAYWGLISDLQTSP